MRGVIAVIIWILGAVLGLYVGGWLMFIKPIIGCCVAFDAGTLTAMMVGMTVIKCFFGSTVGSLIFLVGHCIAMLLTHK